jgi:hypothetical protein
MWNRHDTPNLYLGTRRCLWMPPILRPMDWIRRRLSVPSLTLGWDNVDPFMANTDTRVVGICSLHPIGVLGPIASQTHTTIEISKWYSWIVFGSIRDILVVTIFTTSKPLHHLGSRVLKLVSRGFCSSAQNERWLTVVWINSYSGEHIVDNGLNHLECVNHSYKGTTNSRIRLTLVDTPIVLWQIVVSAKYSQHKSIRRYIDDKYLKIRYIYLYKNLPVQYDDFWPLIRHPEPLGFSVPRPKFTYITWGHIHIL